MVEVEKAGVRRLRLRPMCALLLVVLACATTPAACAQADSIQTIGVQQLSPRMSELTLRSSVLPADVPVRVILPAGYDGSSHERYPVVYLLPGTNNTPATLTDNMDLEAFSAKFPMIIVIPYGGLGSYYTNWFNGGSFGPPEWETFHIDQLIPYIDGRYRTIADRSERAIMGISMGGFGSMSYAARHPDLFTAAVSLSGAVNTDYPPQVPVTTASALLDQGAPDAQFGPRATEEARWRGHNPWDLAENLRGLDTQLFAHNGQAGGPHQNNFDALEMGIHEENLELHDQLSTLGIPNAWFDLGPGAHIWPDFQDEIHIALPHIMSVFASGSHPPDPFTFVSIEPRFSAWGWTVEADPRRALEFLRVQSASAYGVTLVGSGTTTVTTAPLFAGVRGVDVIEGGKTRTVAPDPTGRITFTVDLGPPHQLQQYTALADAADSPPARVSVTFAPRVTLDEGTPGAGHRGDARRVGRPVCAARTLSFSVSGPRGLRIDRARIYLDGHLLKAVRAPAGRQLRTFRLDGLPTTGRHRLRIDTFSRGSLIRRSVRGLTGCSGHGHPTTRGRVHSPEHLRR